MLLRNQAWLALLLQEVQGFPNLRDRCSHSREHFSADPLLQKEEKSITRLFLG
jgi:hypothetical protein